MRSQKEIVGDDDLQDGGDGEPGADAEPWLDSNATIDPRPWAHERERNDWL